MCVCVLRDQSIFQVESSVCSSQEEESKTFSVRNSELEDVIHRELATKKLPYEETKDIMSILFNMELSSEEIWNYSSKVSSLVSFFSISHNYNRFTRITYYKYLLGLMSSCCS